MADQKISSKNFRDICTDSKVNKFVGNNQSYTASKL